MKLYDSTRSLRRLVLLGGLAAAFTQSSAFAPAEGYTRISRSDKTKIALQIRTSKLVPKSGTGPAVWLVGAVHVGDKAYYGQLQQLLDTQDYVLFEGVNRGTEPPKKPDGKSVYESLSDALGLSHQQAEIRYDRAFFRNSDLTWEKLNELSAKEGKETQQALTGISKLLDPNGPQAKELGLFFTMMKSDPGMAEAVRIMMIRVLSGGALKSMVPASKVVIDARNEKVLSDFATLQRENASPKSIAILYGAGHLKHMEEAFLKRFGYRVAEDKWFTAIRGDESKVSEQGKAILKMIGG